MLYWDKTHILLAYTAQRENTVDWFTIIETAIWVVGAATALRASYHYGRASVYREKTIAAGEAVEVLRGLHQIAIAQNEAILFQQDAIEDLRKALAEAKA